MRKPLRNESGTDTCRRCRCTDEEVLSSLGMRNFDCGVVAIGDDIQASILTAILLKDLGVKQVVAKAMPSFMACA